MPRRCSVCTHADRDAVDLALVEGAALRDIARRFGLSKDAAARHRAEHLPSSMIAASSASTVSRGCTLIDKIRALEERAHSIGDRAHKAGDLRTALAAVRELTRIAELQGKLAGDLATAPSVTVAIGVSPEWVAVRSEILSALKPYPEARAALAHALSPIGLAP